MAIVLFFYRWKLFNKGQIVTPMENHPPTHAHTHTRTHTSLINIEHFAVRKKGDLYMKESFIREMNGERLKG